MNNQSSVHDDNDFLVGKTQQNGEAKVSDVELIERMKRGDIHAYTPIMQRYNQRLFRIARSIVKDDTQAMDIVQEAHIKAFLKITELIDISKLSSWLGAITRNEALGYLRTTKRVVKMSDYSNESNRELDDLIFAKDEKPDEYPDALMANQQLKIILNRYIDDLPQNFRTVFILRGVEELSVKETALIEGIKQETVKTRYHRAKKILQNNIMDYLDTAGLKVYEFGGKHCEIIVKNVQEHLLDEMNKRGDLINSRKIDV